MSDVAGVGKSEGDGLGDERGGDVGEGKIRVHHRVELGLNACGVECCPHDGWRSLVAVASYLHKDDEQQRVGQLYLYDLRRRSAGAQSGEGEGDDDAHSVGGGTMAQARP